jgi:hypothetical protein
MNIAFGNRSRIDDDRYFPEFVIAAYFLKAFEPVLAGHIEIQKNNVRQSTVAPYIKQIHKFFSVANRFHARLQLSFFYGVDKEHPIVLVVIGK